MLSYYQNKPIYVVRQNGEIFRGDFYPQPGAMNQLPPKGYILSGPNGYGSLPEGKQLFYGSKI